MLATATTCDWALGAHIGIATLLFLTHAHHARLPAHRCKAHTRGAGFAVVEHRVEPLQKRFPQNDPCMALQRRVVGEAAELPTDARAHGADTPTPLVVREAIGGTLDF